MEVVRNGKTVKTIVCNECDCTFRYSKLDVQVYGVFTQTVEKEVRCPECGHCIKV